MGGGGQDMSIKEGGKHCLYSAIFLFRMFVFLLTPFDT